ncbi:MAG: BspA family leucine-rich repeat surface protein [Atopobiaceae bacterium]|nr:BspA family leucine-rich repeat surface protein [Atopobiaceae bacterium]
MRVRTVSRWVVVLVLLVASVLVLPASAAFADEAEKLSDDGQDYSWLYRSGDLWLDKENDNIVLVKDGDAIYNKQAYDWKIQLQSEPPEGTYIPTGNYFAMVRPQVTLYQDGTLFYSLHGLENLESFIVNGRNGKVSQGDNINIFMLSKAPCRVSAGGGYTIGHIKRVVIDPSMLDTILFSSTCLDGYWLSDEWKTSLVNKYGDRRSYVRYTERWFDGCTNLEEVCGLEYIPTGTVVSMARMFAGCAQLESVDISGFDTSACVNFAEMFDGCESLCELRTGDGWTQERTGEWDGLSDYTQREPIVEPPDPDYARFPVPMVRQEDNALFQAGDVIPDGAGTYIADERTHVDARWLSLEAPQGMPHAGGGGEPLTLEYTGETLEPVPVVVTDDGTELVEGKDYWVSYKDNRLVGDAQVIVHGMGIYYGCAPIDFRIEDTSAWVYLYGDGTLVLKAGHEPLSYSLDLNTTDLRESRRWFDAYEEQPGASVPWADVAANVKRVIVDESFASFSPVTMVGWFAGCSALKEVVGLGRVNTSAVTSAARLFEGCTSLTDLDLSGFVLSAVTDLSAFARGCYALEHVNLADLDVSQATSTARFFEGCASLKEVRTGSGWRNASNAQARLSLGRAGFRTEPSYKRFSSTTELGDGAALYRVADIPMQLASVEVAGQTYVCTGKPITPKVTVKLGDETLKEGSDYSVAYQNNRYPGNATITIAGKGLIRGAVKVPFSLKAGVTKGEKVTYKTKNVVFTFKVTKVGKDGVTADASVVKINVRNPKIQSVTIPSTCTIGKVKVTITTVSRKIVGRFANVSQVVIGPKVTKIGSWAFYYAPSVERLVIKSKRLKSVRDCLAGSNIWEVWTKTSLTKAKRKKYKKWFTYYSGQDWVWYHYR